VSSAAWKETERRICRMFGAERRPSVGEHGWARGSDDDGTAPVCLEVKRTTRYSLRRSWIEQARRNAKRDGRPWLLAIAEHADRAPIAVCDARWLAGLLRELELGQTDGQPTKGATVSETETETTPQPGPDDQPLPDDGGDDDGDEASS
jgi:hypothetical protein